MEEKQEEPSISSAKNRPILCEECKTKPSKYKCPGCSLRSCSLPMSINNVPHAAERNQSLILSRCRNSMTILSSRIITCLRMLNEWLNLLRGKESSCVGIITLDYPYPFPSKFLGVLLLKILFHSNGMSKRKMNKTYYNNRKKFISWTIEWRFHLTDVVLIDHGAGHACSFVFHKQVLPHENATFSSVIENHLKPSPWNHKLKQFCDETDSLKFSSANIRSYDFEVIKKSIPIKMEIKESALNDHLSPKGVSLKVEEIKDVGVSEPYVSNLTYCVYENSKTKKEPEYSVKSPLAVRAVKGSRSIFKSDVCTRATEDSNAVCSFRTMQLAPYDDIDFDLEPGLLDIYSNILSETNIDNLLDFGTVLADEQKSLEVETFLLEEELEEGEIA